MEYTHALNQISEIHEHLAKGEIYRGYRPIPVALTGVCGIVAAVVQARVVTPGDALGFIVFWVAVAVLSCAICGAVILRSYALRDDAFSRRKTRKVVGQLLPSLIAGSVVTVGLYLYRPEEVALLPGLWALVYSLGIFASRPYLPRAIGWVGLFYLAAGAGLLFLAQGGHSLAGWGVGGTFGAGQLAAALVLYGNKERREHV